MPNTEFPFDDAELAAVIGVTPTEFAGMPLWVQVFCRELAAVTS